MAIRGRVRAACGGICLLLALASTVTSAVEPVASRGYLPLSDGTPFSLFETLLGWQDEQLGSHAGMPSSGSTRRARHDRQQSALPRTRRGFSRTLPARLQIRKGFSTGFEPAVIETYDRWPLVPETLSLHAQPDGSLRPQPPSASAPFDYLYPLRRRARWP